METARVLFESPAMEQIELAIANALGLRRKTGPYEGEMARVWNYYTPTDWAGAGARFDTCRLRVSQWENSRQATLIMLDHWQEYIVLRISTNAENGILVSGYQDVLDTLNLSTELPKLVLADKLCHGLLSATMLRTTAIDRNVTGLSEKDRQATKWVGAHLMRGSTKHTP